MNVRIWAFSAIAIALLGTAACVPISPDFAEAASAGTLPAESGTVPSQGSTIPAAAATLDPAEGAIATVATPSLRVRSLPSGTAPLLGALANGEQYRVLSRSSDGGWLELAIPQLARGSGWVSASLVSVNGDITDTPISAVPDAAPAATSTQPAATPTRAATSTPTEAPTEAPTATATLEPTATPTEEPTEAPTATLEPTATPTLEPTATSTEVPTEVPTEAPTVAPTEEPTAAPTEEPTATAAFVLPTATPRPISTPAEEPAAEPTSAPVEESSAEPAPAETAESPVFTAPAAGYAVVIAEPRLRVRSAPTTDAEIVGFGYPGEVFQVLGVSEDGAWTQIAGSAEAVENPNGGWVATEFLLLGQ